MTASGTNSATPPTNTLINLSKNSFEAGHYSVSATLTVNVTVGGVPATDNIGITVLEPTSAQIIQYPGTFKKHFNPTNANTIASVGFLGAIYITPDTVSFWKMKFREGTVEGKGEGYFEPDDGKKHNPNPEWMNFIKGISVATNRPNTVSAADEIWSGLHAPYAGRPFKEGRFTWSIPWYFKIGSHQGTICIMDQTKTINAQGDMTISK
jgi:hypothetical protein